MERTKQELASVIQLINENLPDEQDLKQFSGISKALITDSLTQTAQQLVLLKEYDNHFETILLKRELADVFKEIKDILRTPFAAMKSKTFNDFLDLIADAKFYTRETYLSVVSSEHFRSEFEVSKLKSEHPQLIAQIAAVKNAMNGLTEVQQQATQHAKSSIDEVNSIKANALSVIELAGKEIEDAKKNAGGKIDAILKESQQTSIKINSILNEAEQRNIDSGEHADKIKVFSDTIEDLQLKIGTAHTNVNTWSAEIVKDKEAIEANATAYEKLNQKSIAALNTIEKAKLKIIGELDANGKPVNGYLFDFQNQKEKMEMFLTEQQAKYNSQFKEIEGLLPGATSAGLAKAYQEQKSSYLVPIWLWSAFFVATLLGMTAFSIWAIWQQIKLQNATDLNSLLTAFLKYLPFYLPTIWLAAYASKQQSQYKRLQQEYAFKETNAKSFHGHKVQVEELMKEGEMDTELLRELVASLLFITAQNPSQTLENKSHDDSPPVMRFFERMLPRWNRDKKPENTQAPEARA